MTALIATLTVLLGAIVWLYQKTWERQERKVLIYQEIIGKLPAFTSGRYDSGNIDLALNEMRKLWLYAPDDVVVKIDEFLSLLEAVGDMDSVGDSEEAERILRELIVCLRKDATFCRNIIPRCKTNLEQRVFKIRSARKN